MVRKLMYLPILFLITALPLPAMEGSLPMEEAKGTEQTASQISVKSAPIILTTETGAKFDLEPGVDQLSGTIKGFLKELENEMITTEQEEAAEIFIPGDTKSVELFAQITNELQKKINQETGAPLDDVIEKNLPQIAEAQLENGEIQDFKNLLQLTHYLEMPTWFEDAAASVYISKMMQEDLGPKNIQDIAILDMLGFHPSVSLLLKKNWITHQAEASGAKTLLASLEQTIQDKINQEKTNISPQEIIQAPDGHIVAKNLQPIVNAELSSETASTTLLLLALTHILEKPWLENAIASTSIAKAQQENIAPTKKENLEAWVNSLALSLSTNELLEKHWLLQQAKVEELSIKDLLIMDELPAISKCRLNLSEKNLTSLDGLLDIPVIYKVTDLLLSNNQLTTLPDNIFKGLNNLESLHLDNNNLSTLPENVFKGLNILDELDLEDNQLITLPDNIFSGLTGLKHLVLSYNNLSTLPENIFNHLTKLKWLNLGNNIFSTLPDSIFNGLNNLGWLQLEKNQLTTLPENIFNSLNKLERLYLNNNQFTALSGNIFNGLNSLRGLYLGKNQLSEDEKKKITSKLKEITPNANANF